MSMCLVLEWLEQAFDLFLYMLRLQRVVVGADDIVVPCDAVLL